MIKRQFTESNHSPSTRLLPAGLKVKEHALPRTDEQREKAYVALIYFLVERLEKLPFNELTPTEKVLNFASDLHGQVNNGGFDQWEFNGYGSVARETVAALREIGAYDAARLLVRAVRVMRKYEARADEYEYQDRPKAAERVRDKLRVKLDALNAAYCALPTGVDDLILAFADDAHRENPDSLAGFTPL